MSLRSAAPMHRDPRTEETLELALTCAAWRGLMRGTAPPRSRIEGVCLTALPRQRLCMSDTELWARADEGGRFAFAPAQRRGDLLGLRCRTVRGEVGPWLTMRLRQGRAPRAPCLALFRIGIELRPAARVRLLNFNDSRPIGEPHAALRIANRAASRSVALYLNAAGSFARHTIVPGKPGDTLEVQLRHRGRWTLVGRLKVPPPHAEGRMPRLSLLSGGSQAVFFIKRPSAPVFVGAPRANQVFQGHIANCHFAAAASAVAHARPETFQRLRVLARGERCEFTFFRWGSDGSRERIRVSTSTELFYGPSGELLFGLGRRPGSRGGGQAMWWPLVEKAYATWKGGYQAIGNGGTAHDALATLLGRRPRHRMLCVQKEDEHWAELVELLESGTPVVVSTGPDSARYRNTGIMNNHSYAVLGCRRTARARWVRLRNPWGEVHPRSARAPRAGTFELPWCEVVRHFVVLSFVR